ncbi:MAG: DUF2268 domain-containing putative Zn-dependent protease, partial [Phototrophicaceae bacterium]
KATLFSSKLVVIILPTEPTKLIPMIRIVVPPTLYELKPLYTLEMKPKDRLELAQQLFLNDSHLYTHLSKQAHQHETGLDVYEAIQWDGFKLVAGRQGWGMFNPTRPIEGSRWLFEQYERLDIFRHIHDRLAVLVSAFTHPPLEQITCHLAHGDPCNRSLMAHNFGLTCFGGMAGVLFIQFWYSPLNLQRLDYALARGVIHTLRQAYTSNQAFRTLGDCLVTEGLASHYLMQALPPSQHPAWGVVHAPPADWEDALEQIAQWRGEASYSDVYDNVYSQPVRIGEERAPLPLALDDEELAYSYEVMQPYLAHTHAPTLAACLYGDERIAQTGYPTFGLSPYAGFAVGHHLVGEWLRKHSQRASDALAIPTATFLSD